MFQSPINQRFQGGHEQLAGFNSLKRRTPVALAPIEYSTTSDHLSPKWAMTLRIGQLLYCSSKVLSIVIFLEQ